MRAHFAASVGAWLVTGGAALAGTQGYYRAPCIWKDTIVFSSEGDLWKVPVTGGVATRITTHPGDEGSPRVSPDGATLAFTAQYEGTTEVYTMPFGPGAAALPTRWTYEGGRVSVAGWAPDGRLMYTTDSYSTLPNAQMFLVETHPGEKAGAREAVPLWQASAGTFDDAGRVLYFTRLAFQGSQTKRYKGGTAQNLWKFETGAGKEAVALTGDYAGTSKDPMWWKGRVYFATDRGGSMNIWSMDADGKGLRQHTRHSGFDVASPTLSEGRIAYQFGADIHVLDINGDRDSVVPITLESDLDQTRERWVEKPMEYMTSVHASPDGDRVVMTARGRVFVAPHRQGRLVEATRKEGVRYRAARFMPDGKSVVALSDESGEVELWTVPANGVGETKQLTKDGEVLRWDTWPSPDGEKVAHTDKNLRLWITDVKAGTSTKVDESKIDNFESLAWSPDSRYLAYAAPAENTYIRVKVYDTKAGDSHFVTSDRFVSGSPAWSPDGQWLYLISERNIASAVGSPWGFMQPEPFFDKTSKLYLVALKEGLRSPWAPKDELAPKKDDKKDEKKDDKGKEDAKKEDDKKGEDKKDGDKDKPKKPEVVVEWNGIEKRLIEVPLPAGSYSNLIVTERAIFFGSSESTGERKRHLVGAAITNENPEIKTLVPDVKSFEASADLKKLMVHKGDSIFLVDAAVSDKVDLDKKNVVLNNWSLSVVPREEWRQMFAEAWRLERDYFYDRNMHGVDWKAMLEKFRPLVDRVTTRAELSDVIAQMVAELSALHIFVYGGDLREGQDHVKLASLGAELVPDRAGGGWRVAHIYASDPDQPERVSALAKPEAGVKEGDVVEMIDGVSTLSVTDYRQLLRNKAGVQVLLRVRPAAGGDARDVIVTPMSPAQAGDLRYHEWEYTRRLEVERVSDGQIGYLHLRAMGGGDFSDFAKGYYPVFNRAGLIIDVRHNRGGNIDSWVLSRLLRKVWFYWSDRVGNPPNWNMQYAFRGHVAVLCDERTASDGEAFSEGIKRLKIGRVFGTRTWGGEIWLSSSNFLVDRGIATAAESGVYGPEGQWLIEGHGVEPDVVVDNLPHATFNGEDAQLKAAIEYLRQKMKDEPVPPFEPPARPDKSLKPGAR